MLIGGDLGYRILKYIHPPGAPEKHCTGDAYDNRQKLSVLLGNDIWDKIRGKTVIDYGCGDGAEAVEMALQGAKTVIGIDIRLPALERARANAEKAGVSDRCVFEVQTSQRADIIISLDSFEHFGNPALTLGQMSEMLAEGGRILVSFGPTWFHPYGGHLFSVFPWAHLLFTERALIRWRSEIRSDGAKRFSEVEGGLNQMTIRRFEKIVNASPLQFSRFELVPIRHTAWAHNPLTSEFLTSIIRCELVRNTSRSTN